MPVILGLGFTGSRLARRLLGKSRLPDAPAGVYAAVRGTHRFRALADEGLRLSELTLDRAPRLDPPLPRNQVLALLIPPLAEPENTALHETIADLAPRRVVYVCSTGVYGGQTEVNAETPAEPNDARGRVRLAEEQWIASGPWSSLMVRAAAIYGPNRGVHASFREGRLPRSAGSGIVSRIHVDDLARILEAAMDSDLEGAWPAADEEPCSSFEIAKWCAELPGFERALESQSGNGQAAGAAPAGRRVDGKELRRRLGVELQYPSWRAGITACIAEETAAS